MDKLKMHSPDLTQDHIAKLRELFPGCVTKAKGEDGRVRLAVDFEQLRQELSGTLVEGPQERYPLNWPGKPAGAAAFSRHATARTGRSPPPCAALALHSTRGAAVLRTDIGRHPC